MTTGNTQEFAQAVEAYIGTWAIDSRHSSATFAVKHAMVTTVRGSFPDVSGAIEVSSTTEGRVSASIGVASILTGVEARDNHLRSAEFFDVEQFPTMTFESSQALPTSDSEFVVDGELTIKGVTRPVRLECEFLGAQRDQAGKLRVGFEGRCRISRKDFGLQWNVALEAGGVLVSDTVTIGLDIAAVLEE